MKASLILLVLIITTTAVANVADLNYQVEKGQFQYSTSYEYRKDEVNLHIGSQPISKTDISYHTYFNDFIYGVTDQISAKLGLNYRFVEDREMESIPSGSVYVAKYPGMMAPTIDFSYRILKDLSYIVDLNLGADLDFEARDGNAKRGGPVLRVGADSSYKLNTTEFLTSLSFNYLHDSKFRGNTGSKIDTDPSLNIVFDISLQHQIVDKFFINYGIGLKYFGRVEETYISQYSSTEGKYDTESRMSYSFMFGAKHLIFKNFIGRYGVNYTDYEDYKMDTYTEEYNYSKYKGYSANLGFDYLF